MLIEKGWAKINGNYLNCEKGQISEAFRALSGAPSEIFIHSELKIKELSNEKIWEKINESFNFDFVACGSSV